MSSKIKPRAMLSNLCKELNVLGVDIVAGTGPDPTCNPFGTLKWIHQMDEAICSNPGGGDGPAKEEEEEHCQR